MPDTNHCSMKTRRSPLSIGRPMRVLLTVFVGAFVVWVAPTVNQRRIVARLESLGAVVAYDEQPCSILLKCLFDENASR